MSADLTSCIRWMFELYLPCFGLMMSFSTLSELRDCLTDLGTFLSEVFFLIRPSLEQSIISSSTLSSWMVGRLPMCLLFYFCSLWSFFGSKFSIDLVTLCFLSVSTFLIGAMAMDWDLFSPWYWEAGSLSVIIPRFLGHLMVARRS